MIWVFNRNSLNSRSGLAGNDQFKSAPSSSWTIFTQLNLYNTTYLVLRPECDGCAMTVGKCQPWHHQTWYWLCKVGMSSFPTVASIHHCLGSVFSHGGKRLYNFMFSQMDLAQSWDSCAITKMFVSFYNNKCSCIWQVVTKSESRLSILPLLFN